jgi:predicted DNA-binding transcriptional regulator AlpA
MMTGSNNASPMDPLLCAKEVAKLLNVSTSWLAKSRMKGTGPRFVKVGGAVKYRESAVADYVRARSGRALGSWGPK